MMMGTMASAHTTQFAGGFEHKQAKGQCAS